MRNLIPSLSSSLSTLFQKISIPIIPFRLYGHFVRLAPTRYGVVYFVMLVALLLGSINHNNNLGHILTFLLGSMALVSIFQSVRNISGLKIVSTKASPVFAGETAIFYMTIETKGHDRQGLSFFFKKNDATLVNLGEYAGQTVSVPHETTKRGILKTQPLTIATSYPLNLFKIWSSVDIQSSCIVYPQAVSGAFITDKGSPEEGSDGESGGPGVDDFESLALYQPGDPLQHISWKAYSRGHGLYTKKFEGRVGKTIYFSLESLAGVDIELKLSRICFMILKADERRLFYGLILEDKNISAGFGTNHKIRCLQELAFY